MSNPTSTITQLRISLRNSSLRALQSDIEDHSTALANFKNYYESLVNTLQQDDETLKCRLRVAEKEFNKMKQSTKSYLREVKDLEDEINEAFMSAKRM
jgi:hypothetical protein